MVMSNNNIDCKLMDTRRDFDIGLRWWLRWSITLVVWPWHYYTYSTTLVSLRTQKWVGQSWDTPGPRVGMVEEDEGSTEWGLVLNEYTTQHGIRRRKDKTAEKETTSSAIPQGSSLRKEKKERKWVSPCEWREGKLQRGSDSGASRSSDPAQKKSVAKLVRLKERSGEWRRRWWWELSYEIDWLPSWS